MRLFFREIWIEGEPAESWLDKQSPSAIIPMIEEAAWDGCREDTASTGVFTLDEAVRAFEYVVRRDGQPECFTRDDVTLLRAAAGPTSPYPFGVTRQLNELADRISALLPPTEDQ